QLRHEGDWQPAPRAMPNLMMEMRKLGLDVALQTEDIRPGSPDLVDFRFLYMHGRNQFRLGDDDLKKLRFHLETGGLLLADACCGSRQFDQAFRELVKQLWPDKPLQEIPLTDELYSKELNGTAITLVQCRREAGGGQGGGTGDPTGGPALGGGKSNG